MIEIPLALLATTILIGTLALLLDVARKTLRPSKPVTITVNGSRTIAGSTNRRLLSILNENGVAIPSACSGAGTCGLCRVEHLTGAGQPLPIEMARLSPAELRLGARLACQVTVHQDLEVTVDEAVLGVTSMICEVVDVRPLTPLIREITLALPADVDFAFEAGGFVQVTAPPYELVFAEMDVPEAHRPMWTALALNDLQASSSEPVSRAYSIASPPSEKQRIVLDIRLATPPPGVPGAMPGLVSSWLFARRPGDKVELAGPYGHFKAQDTDREMVFIGGGVGMAPLRSIIVDQLERVGTSRRISFWYGARSRPELFYVEQFDDLARRYPNFSWTAALSDPAAADDWQGATGFIHNVAYEAYLKDHPAPADCEYYLCGPPLMIQAVYAMLDDCGVEPDAIFNDDFGS